MSGVPTGEQIPRTRTHDWSSAVDRKHLALVRERAADLAPGGLGHLVLEVLAYPADEAAATGRGSCVVTFLADGSVRVTDDGRGTEVAVVGDGTIVRKPVMSSADVRFFDSPSPPRLPDGFGRRGISVVAALSAWLVHTNRRADGAWTQRYEYGVPVTGLVEVPRDGTTGTTVHLMPAPVAGAGDAVVADVGRWSQAWPQLTVRIDDARGVTAPGSR